MGKRRNINMVFPTRNGPRWHGWAADEKETAVEKIQQGHKIVSNLTWKRHNKVTIVTNLPSVTISLCDTCGKYTTRSQLSQTSHAFLFIFPPSQQDHDWHQLNICKIYFKSSLRCNSTLSIKMQVLLLQELRILGVFFFCGLLVVAVPFLV